MKSQDQTLSDKQYRSIVIGSSTIAPVHVEASLQLQEEEQHVKTAVAELAYGLYEQRGREDGHDLDDWLQAESRLERAKGSTPRRGF